MLPIQMASRNTAPSSSLHHLGPSSHARADRRTTLPRHLQFSRPQRHEDHLPAPPAAHFPTGTSGFPQLRRVKSWRGSTSSISPLPTRKPKPRAQISTAPKRAVAQARRAARGSCYQRSSPRMAAGVEDVLVPGTRVLGRRPMMVLRWVAVAKMVSDREERWGTRK